MGTPRIYCSCAVCEEARSGGMNRRTRSSVWIESSGEAILLDCGPDWLMQMERMGIKSVHSVLLTHAHYDHIAGLPEWADACRYTGRKGHVHAPAEVISTLRKQFPWIENQLIYHENDAGFHFQEWFIQPWRVCHGKNGYAYGYLFVSETRQFRWSYVSDSIDLKDEQRTPLEQLDLLILGTSYVEEFAEFSTRSVYDIKEALQLIQEVRPRRVLFTHMSHGVDIREQLMLPEHAALAREGMQLQL